MTYGEICARLKRAGVESAEWDAELLLEHFCGTDRLALRSAPEKQYDCPALEEAVTRREARFPLQYLLGEWSFYRQSYEVSPDCLIPRSDTEILVEEAVRRLPSNAVFADLCTGSGCIAISTLAERPDTRATAVEKFPNTLAVAERNAARNGVRDRLTAVCADVLRDGCLPEGSLFDAILSNPPYIRQADLATLAPELSAEPLAALDGGADGLLFYRAILSLHAKHLRPGGFFLFEIGYDQADDIAAIASRAGFDSCRIIRDLGGNDRVALVERGKK